MSAVAPITNEFPSASHVDEPNWFAIHIRARHEKKVHSALCESGIETFLPLSRQIHRWSDRSKAVDVPLFPCYSFVRISFSHKQRLQVLRTSGVLGFVGVQFQATPVPEHEIEQIRKLLDRQIPCSPYPFLKVGQRVRIRGGSLDGMEGIWLGHKRKGTLIISVELIQRSLAISVEGFEVEPV